MRIDEIEYMHYLNKLKEQSACLDKQVACIIVDADGEIVAEGINIPIECDKNCHDKENRKCVVIHAEIEACKKLTKRKLNEPLTAYVNLFPCVPCQKTLSNFVEEIVSFSPQHKNKVFPNIRIEKNIYTWILFSNGINKQLSIAQGELAELITCISDYFYRPDKRIPTMDLIDEIIDAEFMIDQIKLILWKKEPETYNFIRQLRSEKFLKLLKKLEKQLI